MLKEKSKSIIAKPAVENLYKILGLYDEYDTEIRIIINNITKYLYVGETEASCSVCDLSGVNNLEFLLFQPGNGFTTKTRLEFLTTLFNKIIKYKKTKFILLSTTAEHTNIIKLLNILCKTKTKARKSLKTGKSCIVWIY